ncbi:MAG: hypothetical protein NT126_10495 [Bacteroidetes bacterium]|nr:hypothetical protein [Bacteroidota bacterium]
MVFIIPCMMLVLSLPFNAKAQQQDLVKLMAYNLLNYPDQSNFTVDTTTRNAYLRVTISSATPDILVVEEMNSQVGVNGFLSNVLNYSTSTYSAGTFIDGPDTDNGIFYKTSKFHFVSNTRVKTDLRDISEFKLVHLLSGDTLRIYAVHLKASSGTANEAQRALEVDSLRKVTNALPAGSNFIICGDFNFYSANESAYQKLLQINPTDEGYFIDPITMPGTWNNSTYAIHHTQSTRLRAFGGGSTGGMDDRFDLILYSKAISLSGGMTYVSNSTTAYGNDGNHYNDSINHMPNTAVSLDVANALHYTSDHLPVMANFNFQYGTSAAPDAGVLSLLSPSSSICSNANQVLQVQVKNYGTDTIKFLSNNMLVTLQATNPSSVTQSFSKTISSGILTAGSIMTVAFDSSYNMTNAGTYLFNATANLIGDVNSSNNAMPAATVVVNANPVAAVTPPGPLTICPGSSATLTASAGSSFLWSNGATTQSIAVTDSGHYSVTVITVNGCSSTSSSVNVSISGNRASGTVFTETMGTVAGTTAIATHETANGFDNDGYTMSGSADVRITQSSLNAYAGASGGANIFFTTTAAGKNFIISGINTSGLTNLQISFGIFKSNSASTGSDFKVMVSSDGVTYSNLSFAPLPTGTGTGIWYLRNSSGTIPAVPNLRIQFRSDTTLSQYRIDDVVLSYSGITPSITPSGSTTLCQGDSVILTANSGVNYLWNTGDTTQSIAVKSSGNYVVSENCLSSSPVGVTVNTCSVTLDMRIFIEGFYAGNRMMNAVPDPIGHPALCDTISVELHESFSPFNIAASVTGTITTGGYGSFVFPPFVTGNSYYIVVRHRQSLETWSKFPVTFNSPVVSFDFTSP